jgi:transposase-like protein
VQTCIVRLIRKSSVFVSWKKRKAILPSMKVIYRAENTELVRLEEFEAEVGQTLSACCAILCLRAGIRKMRPQTRLKRSIAPCERSSKRAAASQATTPS